MTSATVRQIVWSAIRVCLVVAAAVVVAFEASVRWGDYDVDVLRHRPESSLQLMGVNGALLASRVNADGYRHQWVPLDAISPSLIEATLAVEDARFFEHSGVDWWGVGRAAWDSMVHGGVVSGASTITMQLVRSLQPHPYKGMIPKWVEMVRARRLERAVDKRTVLEHYFNRISYGAGTIGVEAASWRFFGKSSRSLNLSEAALLAGLPQAPTRYNPRKRPALAFKRRAKVLARMADVGIIGADQFTQLLAARPTLVVGNNPRKAPHLADQIARDRGTGVWHSTIDEELQQGMTRLTADHAIGMAGKGAPHAAIVVMDNHRCEVRAMVGSPEYASSSGAVNGATALRQPGSTLKPFVYALAFEDGFHEGSVVPDVPTRYAGPGGRLYTPRNYDRRFSGPVAMGEALARSLNVPAVVTAGRVGLKRLHAVLKRLGFTSLTHPAEYYGLGLALGNGEVRLIELAQAYAALARQGRACQARMFKDHPVVEVPVLSAKAAAQVTHILADEQLRAQSFGALTAWSLPEPVAMKTGTSANWRDTWAIGYTRTHTVAVWMGDFDPRPSHQLTGATGAGPLFLKAMEMVLNRFGQPPSLVDSDVEAQLPRVEVCALSGMPVAKHCPHRRRVRQSSIPDDVSCRWHRQVRIEKRSGLRAGPACSDEDTVVSVVAELPSEYAEWQAMQNTFRNLPRFSPRCPQSPAGAVGVKVTWPHSHAVFVLNPRAVSKTQTVRLRARVEPRVAEATWWVDGRPWATVGWPYSAAWPLTRGRHQIQLAVAGTRSAPVTVEVR